MPPERWGDRPPDVWPGVRPDGRPDRRPGPLALLAGAIWPASCAGCGAPDVRLCRACARPLRERGGRVAALAGTTAPGAPPTWATAAYEGRVRAAVVAWKDRGRADLDRWLVPALAEAVLAALEQAELLARGPVGGPVGGPAGGPVLLVPVPSRAASARARGRDVVGDLARDAAVLLRRRGAPVLAVPALLPWRGTRDQVGLDASSRAGNVGLSMRALLPDAGAPVLLVDDVVTTGATLAEAARALRAGGAPVVGAAAVAATQRREHPTTAARLADPPPRLTSGGWLGWS